VGDCVRDRFGPGLSAENAVAVTPDRDPFLLQQAHDADHLLGIEPGVADKNLRLVASPGRLTNHDAGFRSQRDTRKVHFRLGWVSIADPEFSPEQEEHAL